MNDHKLDITVLADTCAGTSNCERLAPHTFRVTGGLSRVVDPAGDSEEDVIEAAMGCPVEAIMVTDANGRNVYPPD